MIEFMAQMYTNDSGALQKLARMTGCTEKLMKRSPPLNAQDFARKMIDGTYQADKTEATKAEMRDKLRWELKVQERKGLRRTTTKEATGEASFEDVSALSQAYARDRGDLNMLSKSFKIPVNLLQ